MAIIPSNTIVGSVKVLNLPETACYETFAEFVKDLAKYLVVEIAAGDISNVIISTQQPGEGDTGKLWVRRTGSGQVIGLYVFVEGKWVALFPPEHGVFWMWGDSRTPDPGYKLIEQDSGIIPPADYPKFSAQYIKDPTNTYFVYFATTFIGV